MQNLPIAIDSFDQYMSTIRQFEPLDRDSEIELARRYKNDNDLGAAHRLTCANLRFVVKIANEYRGYGLKMLDLIQEGNIGLMMAIKKFDPERNIRLISYAVWWIRAYIHAHIINSWSLVKIGTTQAQKKLFFKLRQTRDTLRQLTGSDDNDSIAHELDVSCDAVDEMSMRLSSRDNSLDGQLSPEGGASPLDNLADERINQEEQLLELEAEQQQKLNVQQAMATLNQREQHIISSRLLAEDKTTLQELAEYYQISKERVRQLEKRALEKLKDNLCATLVTDNT
jgi:RNA polymerase sigma-32 factor